MPNRLFAWAWFIAMVSARAVAMIADVLATVCFFMLGSYLSVVVVDAGEGWSEGVNFLMLLLDMGDCTLNRIRFKFAEFTR